MVGKIFCSGLCHLSIRFTGIVFRDGYNWWNIYKVNDDLKAEIQKLSTNISEKFTNIYKEVELVQERCDDLEDLFSRQNRRKELIVRYVAVLKDESVDTIIKTVCSVIGFLSSYGAPVAFRLRGNIEAQLKQHNWLSYLHKWEPNAS